MNWRINLKTHQHKIPSFEEIMFPLLQYSKHGKICSMTNAEKFLADEFQLSQEERNKLKPSGRESIFLNRLRWARLYLKKANLIFDPKKDHFQITDTGKKFLKNNPKTLNSKILMSFPEFKRWKNKINEAKRLTEGKRKVKKLSKKIGVVILIDALGTKGIWKKNDSSQVLKKWTQFNKNIQDSVLSLLGENNEVSFASFSDTIIITAVSKNIEQTICDISDHLSVHVIESMLIDMPIRGCFSIGEFHKEEQLIIGQAIDEAAGYYTLPQWIGISASPSAHILIEKMFRKDPKKTEELFQKFDIPLKKSIEQNAWALNWVDISDQFVFEYSKIPSDKKFENMRELIYEKLENTSDIDISLKWRNTMKFYEMVNEKIL